MAEPGAALPGRSREGELDQLLEEYLARIRRGERPTPEEYARARPDLAADIRELFPAMEAMEELGAGPAAPREPVDAGQALPGRIGDFRIVREVGRGGMGVVYEAMQESLGRRVALKVLPRSLRGDARTLERFRREARAAARLHHANIVPVFGVGDDGDLHYYAMQFIEGRSLEAIIGESRLSRGTGPAGIPALERRSRDSAARRSESGSAAAGAPGTRHHRAVARVGLEVAEALAYAHAQGVLHRDIKPSNLLLDAEGTIWIADFGLAKADEPEVLRRPSGAEEGEAACRGRRGGGSASPTKEESLTQAGDIVGTIAYLAPERLEGTSDGRSDVYALGLTLHEILTLEPAFADVNRSRLIRRIAEESPVPLRRLDPTIPRDLETIILTATARDPARRYPSAARMAADLRSFLAGQPISARRASRLERLGRWCRREPVLAALGSLVLVLLLTIAVAGSFGYLKLRELLGTATSHLERARTAEGKLADELRRSYLAQARASRLANRPGRRYECLEAVRRAAALGPTPAEVSTLRDEAIAALALADLRITRRWSRSPHLASAMAPDLQTSAHATADGKEIVIRRAAGGAEVARLPAAGAAHGSLHFSPDGRWLAARLEEAADRLAVFDLLSRERVLTSRERTQWHGLGFDPSSRLLAIAGERAVHLFDLPAGKELVQYSFRPPLGLLAFHPVESRIAFASDRCPTIRIVEAATGRTIASIEHDVNHESIAWSPSGAHLAAGDPDGSVHLWEVTGETPRLLWTRPRSLEAGDPVTRLCWNPRGNLLASYSWSSRFRLLDPQGGDLLLSAEWAPQWFTGEPPGLLVSLGNYEYAFAESADQDVRRLIGRIPGRDPMSFARLHVSPDGRILAAAHPEGVGLLDLEAGRDLPFLAVKGCLSALFSPDGRWLFTGGHAGLQRWPVEREKPDGAPGAAAFGPPEVLAEVKGSSARWISLSGDGKKAAIVGDRDRAEVVVVDLSGAEPRKLHLRPHLGVDRISIRPDGKRLVSGTWLAQDVKVWDLDSGELERTIPFPDSAFVEFSPCGNYLAVMSPLACFLHDARTFELLRRIEKPSQLGFPGIAVFRGDGKVLAISHERASLRLLDPSTGGELAILESPSTVNYSFAIHPDGRRIFVGNTQGRIHAWDLNLLHQELRGLGLDWSDPGR